MVLPVMIVVHPCVELQDFGVCLVDGEDRVREGLNINIIIEISICVVEMSLLKVVKMLEKVVVNSRVFVTELFMVVLLPIFEVRHSLVYGVAWRAEHIRFARDHSESVFGCLMHPVFSGVLTKVVFCLLACLVSPINVEPFIAVVYFDRLPDDVGQPSVVHPEEVGDGAEHRVVDQ